MGMAVFIVLLLGITVSLGSSLSTSRLHLRPLFFLDRVFPGSPRLTLKLLCNPEFSWVLIYIWEIV